jgi:hypothetical protein
VRRLRRTAALGAAALAWTAAAAGTPAGPAALAQSEPSYQVGDPPSPCTGSFFSDQIGTNGRDTIQAQTRPQRLWGLAGADRLTGSATRVSCLFGGRGNDLLDLAAGGGVAFGERGEDRLVGSPVADQLDGGPGVDGFEAGAGGDKVDTRDGRAELVDCGSGQDLVTADRADVLFGCEESLRSGRPLPIDPVQPAAVRRRSATVRLAFRIPEAAGAGAYRVVLTSGAREPGCAPGPRELTRLPEPGRRVRAGQAVRVGLHPPDQGWCPGTERAVLVLYRRCRDVCAAPPAGEPLARLRWRVTGG